MINFTWTNVPSATGYYIQVALDSGFSSLVIDDNSLTTNSYSTDFPTLDYLTEYFWRVRCSNIHGDGEWSEIFSFTTTVNPPENTNLLTPGDGYLTALQRQAFDWDVTPYADTYDFEISTTGDFSNIVIAQYGIDVPSFTIPLDETLTNGQSYFWHVRGVNANTSGPWSEVRDFTVNEASLPEIPVLVSPPNGNIEVGAVVDFVWNISDRSISYDFQLATDSGFTSLLIDTNLTQTTYEYTFTANATYYWRVRGRNSFGVSDWISNTVILNATYPLPDFTTGLVAKWTAQSGLTYDANNLISSWIDTIGSINAIQTVDANKPKYNAGNTNGGGINGKPYVVFDGGDNLDLSATPLNATNCVYVFVYQNFPQINTEAKHILGGTSEGIAVHGSAANLDLFMWESGAVIRGTPYDATNINKWNLAELRATKFVKNGIEAGTYSFSGTPTGTITIKTIGARTDNLAHAFNGRLAEIRVYSSLSDANATIVRNFLNQESEYAIY